MYVYTFLLPFLPPSFSPFPPHPSPRSLLFSPPLPLQSFPICESKITAMCSVSYCLWLGTENGEIIILDLVSKHSLFRRYLSVHADQAIMGLYHLVSLRLGDSQWC